MAPFFQINPLHLLRFISIALALFSLALLAASYFITLEPKTPFNPETAVQNLRVANQPLTFDEKIFSRTLPKAIPLLEKIKENLLFFGPCDRPCDSRLFFGYKGSNQTFSLKEGVRILLPNYPHPIWIETSNGTATVGFQEEKISFELQKMPFSSQSSSFEIGSLRVDPTLLARQRVKWVGEDLFLTRHGNAQTSTHRLDFDVSYSLFIKEGSLLIWKEGMWQVTNSIEEVQNYPLFQIQKIDEKTLHGTIYASDAPLSCPITISKYPELQIPPKAPHLFHYIGSRNLKEWLFEVAGKKVSVKEGDWWLGTDKGWQLLDTEESIDAYVERKLTGELFVIESCQRVKGEKMLMGHVFNVSRTKEWEVSIPIKHIKTNSTQKCDEPSEKALQP